jgi:alkanesulfonate monooxygenase SsuD/methylene tetrahydromethanopterin reductase-like flavin-dependent oxidoreductase (luciferase family)
MQYGAHLPLIALDDAPITLGRLREYTTGAAALGYRYLCANDHLLFAKPWLDGPTALAASADAAGEMTLATTVALPVIRGPVATAKLLATLDRLSDGRLVAGLGAGSSARDYQAAGVPFAERWPRFDEAVRALRALLDPDAPAFTGRFYSTEGLDLAPRPVQPHGPPLWLASWGSPARLRQVVRLGDGWMASGYNTTPEHFRSRLHTLPSHLPHAIATTWLYVTDTRRDRDRVLSQRLTPLLGRTPDAPLPIGPPAHCAEVLSAYARAGAQRIFLWPLGDELAQLERFRNEVAALIQPP